jgi:hypothetical protein
MLHIPLMIITRGLIPWQQRRHRAVTPAGWHWNTTENLRFLLPPCHPMSSSAFIQQPFQLPLPGQTHAVAIDQQLLHPVWMSACPQKPAIAANLNHPEAQQVDRLGVDTPIEPRLGGRYEE